MKNKYPVHIILFSVVKSSYDFMPLFIFPHGFTVNIDAYIKCREKVAVPWIEGMPLRRLKTWRLLSNCEVISVTSSYMTFDYRGSSSAISLILMCGGWLSDWLTTLCSSTKINRRIILLFNNFNQEIVREACWKFRYCLKAFDEINSYFVQCI